MMETRSSRRIGRSMGAVLAGFLAVVILSIGTDVLLPRPMSDTLFLMATLYRTLYGVAGGYMTARLAPDRPLRHALAGGLVGLALSVLGAVATWNEGPDFGPHWYPLALVVLALPSAWAGGKLFGMRRRGLA
ncbi:MAG: hypothetical protein ABUS49_13025 [Acidobacteriota bacterium]